ncbi:MAG: hypothetical protein GY805_01425, partial [Chloroflexi bacterium]|nr:hypothetical protein [Chloroflexota bacterium]
MRLLIVGDSITEGNPGIGYVQLLETAFAESNIINLGMGGDTIQGIGKRAIAYLQKDKSFDAIIIEAGHNDIILPDFSRKSLLHKLIA